jgi:hypothetical protein
VTIVQPHLTAADRLPLFVEVTGSIKQHALYFALYFELTKTYIPNIILKNLEDNGSL